MYCKRIFFLFKQSVLKRVAEIFSQMLSRSRLLSIIKQAISRNAEVGPAAQTGKLIKVYKK